MASAPLPASPPAPAITDEQEAVVQELGNNGSKGAPSASTNPEAAGGPIDASAAATPAAGSTAAEVGIEPVGKKKKKKKSGGKSKGRSKPSGFEEYVVDGPLTKEEYQAEQELYALSKPFPQRMEKCLQRYKARRKWDPTRLQMFNTYLALGGISTGQKQFSGGMDERKMDDMDAEDIAMMAATDYVSLQDTGTEDDEEWEVDFLYVIRGFLSYKVPYVLGYKRLSELELACKMIRNFLNYVVFHSVAPEYQENLAQALELCNLAEKELVLCTNVSNRLPGSFNMACSTLFDGFYAGVGDIDKTWDVGVDKEAGLDERLARDLFRVALSKLGTPDQQAKGLDRKVVRRDYMSLEVVEIVKPSGPDPRLGKDDDKTLPENKFFRGTHALGLLKVKPWIPEDPLMEHHDLPEDQREELEIWLEKACLQFCFVGMHLEARVHRFDDGLIFIDSVTGVLCSFFLRLENPIHDSKDSDDEYD